MLYTLYLIDATGPFAIDDGGLVELIRSCRRWLGKGNAAFVARYDSTIVYGEV